MLAIYEGVKHHKSGFERMDSFVHRLTKYLRVKVERPLVCRASPDPPAVVYWRVGLAPQHIGGQPGVNKGASSRTECGFFGAPWSITLRLLHKPMWARA